MTPRSDPGRRGEATAAAPARPAHPPTAPIAATADAAAADRAAWALWGVLALLAAARAVLAFVPSMWVWGLNLGRFLPIGLQWWPWALAAAALAPPVARRAQPGFDRLGRDHRFVLTAIVLIAATGIAAWLLPDRIRFVGDAQLRLGAVQGNVSTALLFPQAMPLDLFVHHTLVHVLSGVLTVDIPTVERLLGAAEAATLALLAFAFTRVLGLRGGAALAAAVVALAGGYLGMFTGYGKSFSEMCVLTAAVGVFGVRVAREGRGLLGLGIAVALGLLLHRSAVGFLLPMAVAWWLGYRHWAPGGEWRRPPVLAGLGLPLIAVAGMAPRIITAVGSLDRPHFIPQGSGLAALMSAAVNPLHLADLANTVLLLSPLALALPALAAARGPGPRRSESRWVLLALVIPFAAALLLIHPRQGMFRDWDDFSAAGVALSFWAAWRIGETLAASPRTAWLGLAAALGAAVPAAQWLAHQHDPAQAEQRVHAYLVEPPPRPDSDRALIYSFLSVRHTALGRLADAADEAGQAAALAPSPRLTYEWASAAADAGDLKKSQQILLGLVERASPMLPAWLALGEVSYQLRDTVNVIRAARTALDLSPGNPEAEGLLQRLQGRAPGGP